MKKTFAVALVLLLVAVIAVDAAVIKVKVATANVRAKPDLMAPVVSRVSQGALFEVQKKTGTWYEVSVVDNAGNIVTGYINADVVEEVGGGAPPAQTTQPRAAQPAATAPSPAPSYSTAKAAGKFFLAAGPVLSNLAFSEDLGDTKKSPRFGFAAGVGYEMPLSQNIALVPTVLFTTGGATFSAGKDKIKYIANALAVPVLVKISFDGPYVVVGPYLGLVMSPKVKVQFEGQPEAEEDIPTEDMNTFQYGLVLGGGFEIPMGTNTFAIQIAYSLGLSKLNKPPAGATSTDTVKPNAINIFGIFKF